MQYWEIIDNLKTCALMEPNINDFIAPDIYTLNSKPDINYNVVAVTPNTINMDEDTVNYSLYLYFVTRWDETDVNQIEGQSIGITVLTNIINRFNALYPDVQITYPFVFTPFYERFKDQTCGVYVMVNFTVDNDLGVCNGE